MATTSKFTVYNDALRELGSHPLANLTSTNTRLTELNGAFPHAVEYLLARVDWNFARRRASLTGTADSSFPSYTYRYARPSDYLRKLWVKVTAADEFQTDHAEIAAVIYGFEPTVLMEYMSDHADVYEPVNWPPQFTRCVVIYLAMLVGPKLARIGDGDAAAWYQKLDLALADAERAEAIYTNSTQINAARIPVMRRAIELIGQTVGGSVMTEAHLAQLRWAMNQAWPHALRMVLESASWTFARKRSYLSVGAEAAEIMPGAERGGIIEGYVVDGAQGASEVPLDNYAYAGYTYGWHLPDDFRSKIWLKSAASSAYEVDHRIVRDAIFANQEPLVLEYIAEDDWTSDPAHWPATIVETVAARLALSVVPELVVEQDTKGRAKVDATGARAALDRIYSSALSDAKNKDAIQQLPAQIPPGRFVQARMGWGRTRGMH